jgi:GNAT superfamily N-acetyltransferase
MSRSEYEFSQEILSSKLASEMQPLLEKHWREVSANLDIELDVDWDKYFLIQRQGGLRIYTVREEFLGTLLGYAVYFVGPNPHYKQSLQAVQDVLFVDPKHRGMGGALIAFGDKRLKRAGVQAVYHHVKCKHNFGPLLERQGYGMVEYIYMKRLDKN